MTAPPKNALGANLILWLNGAGRRTVVSLQWDACQGIEASIHFEARLYDASGAEAGSWRVPVSAGGSVFLDSAVDGPGPGFVGEGVLALYACTEAEPTEGDRSRYNRLYPFVDWLNPDGSTAVLHSDHSTNGARNWEQRFTEIVVLESTDERNALVFLNGEHPQAAGSLELVVQNHRAETRVARYEAPMAPFSVHRIALCTLIPDLVDFVDGEPALVSGCFASKGIFSRPYVETTGVRAGVYHGGDLYQWPALPRPVHLLIGGEVNPMAVVHDAATRTYVNVLHSHGDIEDDIWVDAAVFDASGALVARRKSWLLARRNRLARRDVAELLPDPESPFLGHIALSFSTSVEGPVPRRLQALLEYRRADSVARVMAWSDEWNSAVRLAKRDRDSEPVVGRSYCRAMQNAELETVLAITNAGHEGYRRDASVRLHLYGPSGKLGETSFTLPPHATRFAGIEELFSLRGGPLLEQGLALVHAESESDLANLMFTRHRRTGAIAAEHFLPLHSEHHGSRVLPPGS